MPGTMYVSENVVVQTLRTHIQNKFSNVMGSKPNYPNKINQDERTHDSYINLIRVIATCQKDCSFPGGKGVGRPVLRNLEAHDHVQQKLPLKDEVSEEAPIKTVQASSKSDH